MNPKVPWFSSNTSYMCNTAVPMLVPNEPAVHGKTAIHAAQLTLDTHPRPKSTCGSHAVQLPLVALLALDQLFRYYSLLGSVQLVQKSEYVHG